jgi:hypothetical protein
MKTSGTEYRTWIRIHTTMPTLFLTKSLKIYKKKTACSTNVIGKCGYPSAKKTRTRSPHTGINSKWIKDLNIRLETLKSIQKRAGNTLEVVGIGKDFLNRTQQLSN